MDGAPAPSTSKLLVAPLKMATGSCPTGKVMAGIHWALQGAAGAVGRRGLQGCWPESEVFAAPRDTGELAAIARCLDPAWPPGLCCKPWKALLHLLLALISPPLANKPQSFERPPASLQPTSPPVGHAPTQQTANHHLTPLTRCQCHHIHIHSHPHTRLRLFVRLHLHGMANGRMHHQLILGFRALAPSATSSDLLGQFITFICNFCPTCRPGLASTSVC